MATNSETASAHHLRAVTQVSDESSQSVSIRIMTQALMSTKVYVCFSAKGHPLIIYDRVSVGLTLQAREAGDCELGRMQTNERQPARQLNPWEQQRDTLLMPKGMWGLSGFLWGGNSLRSNDRRLSQTRRWCNFFTVNYENKNPTESK